MLPMRMLLFISNYLHLDLLHLDFLADQCKLTKLEGNWRDEFLTRILYLETTTMTRPALWTLSGKV